MPFGHQTAWQRQALPKPEILSYPLETTVIDSAVINAAGVTADASGPYTGRRYLLAGTILSKRGDTTYERFASALPARTSPASCSTPWSSRTTRRVSNEPVAFLRRNVSFQSRRRSSTSPRYQVPLKAALSTCEFV